MQTLSEEVMSDGVKQSPTRLTLAQTFRGRLRRLYKRTYPWINMAFECWLMVYNVTYAFERTPFYRPWLSWVGVDLRRLSVEDMVSLRSHVWHAST
jgi:Pex2 / Pex12 amino terminal region